MAVGPSPEDLERLLGLRVGGEVELGTGLAEEPRADHAAHEIQLEPARVEALAELGGERIDGKACALGDGGVGHDV